MHVHFPILLIYAVNDYSNTSSESLSDTKSSDSYKETSGKIINFSSNNDFLKNVDGNINENELNSES